MEQRAEKRWSVNIDGWPTEVIEQAPADIELVIKPDNEDPRDFLTKPGLVCWSSGLTDPVGATLMHVVWNDPNRPGRRVSTQWIIKKTDGGLECNWEHFKEALINVEDKS